MKASELIKKLQEQIESHGDCEVWVGSYDRDFDYENSYPVSGTISMQRVTAPMVLENTIYIR